MAFLTLAVFSAAAGVLILAAFKATSNQAALRATRRKLRSNLLAIRLFADDPLVILRAQGRLLVSTGRYLALLVPAFLVVGIPLFFAWDYLDAIWGRAPLAPGETAILTARVEGDADGLRLVTPGWLAVESPAVHVEPEREVSWRLRVLRPGSGNVMVLAGAQRASKRIVAMAGWRYLADREKAAGGPIQWLEIRYPRSSLNWPVWFFLISTITALAFRHRLRVTF